jgi:hypothetical protein
VHEEELGLDLLERGDRRVHERAVGDRRRRVAGAEAGEAGRDPVDQARAGERGEELDV